jgi:hypothetical protein
MALTTRFVGHLYDLAEAATKLFDNKAFNLLFGLTFTFSLFGLSKQALACGLHDFVCNKVEWLPDSRDRPKGIASDTKRCKFRLEITFGLTFSHGGRLIQVWCGGSAAAGHGALTNIRLPTQSHFNVLAAYAATALGASNLRFVALAVVFQAPRSLTIASFIVASLSIIAVLANLQLNDLNPCHQMSDSGMQ